MMSQAQRAVAIVQARMGSSRLPGKVLMDIEGQTMLARVIHRLRRASSLDEIVVATTLQKADETIIEECNHLEVYTFRGAEEDVLDRYVQAANASEAQVVVRITSDCPFVDPQLVDQVIGMFLDAHPDYASNTLVRTYPLGLDVEVMTQAALIRAWRQASEPYQRVHVTPYIYEHPELFQLLSVTATVDYSPYRWTVDTLEDLGFARAVYARLGNTDTFTWQDVVRLLDQEPSLTELNRHIRQKSLQEG